MPVGLVLAMAVLWMAVGGSFTVANLLLGLALSAAAVALVWNEIRARRRWRWRPVPAAKLAALFVKELILSALRVATLVLKPRMDLRPGLIRYPLRVRRDGEIMLLANLITLTPGTLTVDVSPDRQTLLVHAIDARDPDAVCRDIRDGFERLILAASR